MPTAVITARARALCASRWASAISASVPPSPLLSARMISRMYLTVTTRISDQTISDSVPSTSRGVIACALSTSMEVLKA